MKIKILIAMIAMFLINNSSWGQVINLSSITDRSTTDYIVGSNPQVKNDYSSPVLLAYPVGTVSAVSIPAGGTAFVGYPGIYGAGSPAGITFFIYFL